MGSEMSWLNIDPNEKAAKIPLWAQTYFLRDYNAL
jgi:hypothetical protein